jgi:hypothetical protein
MPDDNQAPPAPKRERKPRAKKATAAPSIEAAPLADTAAPEADDVPLAPATGRNLDGSEEGAPLALVQEG